MLSRILTAPVREQRPSLTELAQCFDQAGLIASDPGTGRTDEPRAGTTAESGVAGWRPRTANSVRGGRPPGYGRTGISRNAPAYPPSTRPAAADVPGPMGGVLVMCVLAAAALAVIVALLAIR
jgi:hypothetical protein